MGWQEAPATFQKATDLLLRGIKGTTVLAYIDDLIVFTKTFNEHVTQVTEVCRRLHEAGRAIKLSKVRWAKDVVDFLGFRIGKGLVTPKEGDVKSVLEIEEPRDDAALQHFLGCAGVYRKFIPDLSTLTSPMYKCGSIKGVPFVERWNKACRVAFQRVRTSLENMAGMELPKGSYEQAIQVSGDRSGYGRIFLQRPACEYPWKPVEFFSGSYRDSEWKRSGPERIVMAVADILLKIRPYINVGQTVNIFFMMNPELIGL